MINPCALWSLRTVVEGGLDGLAVAQVDGHRVVAPFPIAVRDGEAWVACGGTRQFQVVVDGARVVTAQANAERWRVAWP